MEKVDIKKIHHEYLGDRNEKKRLLLSIIIGELFCAVAMAFFFQQKQLLSGGIGGISLMIHYITGIPTAYFMFFLNIPLVLLGYANLSKKFTTYGMISPFILSIYLLIFENMKNPFILKDSILVALTGGVLNGIGMGIMFRNGTCQGGLDILAAIFKKKWEMNIGNALLAMNSLVIVIASVIFGLDKGLYTICSM
ncbi:MAG: YitT family protein, partial [Tissierellia bacterium]|nr:YitT family protein [Tissierellia bacterium]